MGGLVGGDRGDGHQVIVDISSPHTLIVGTGAMASLFAARLAASGVPVKMLGSWPPGLKALRKRGVCLVEADGSEHYYPVEVTDDPNSCLGMKSALVLVKSWQTLRAAQQLSICLDSDGIALTLQNGLDNHPVLAEVLGLERAAVGVTTVGATLLEPGRVKMGGNGMIALGAHNRLEPLADLLKTAGFTVEIAADTEAMVWGKLVINTAINPLTALLQVPNGELLTNPAGRDLMGLAALEAAAVATARRVSLPFPNPVEAVEAVAQRTGGNLSSMLRDIQRGGPTEIDAINGAVVRLGEQNHVPTPVNHTLWQLVKALESALARWPRVAAISPPARIKLPLVEPQAMVNPPS